MHVMLACGCQTPRCQSEESPPCTYHHGKLREALIEATLRLVEEGGPEAVTVREAARRSGVSSGAPFRHFPNRTVLMTAVAEEATHRLHAAVLAAVEPIADKPPLVQLRAIGRAYLHWAADNPTYCRRLQSRADRLRKLVVDEARERGHPGADGPPARCGRCARGREAGRPRPRLRTGAYEHRRPPAPMGRVVFGRSPAAMDAALDLFSTPFRPRG